MWEWGYSDSLSYELNTAGLDSWTITEGENVCYTLE
jgi:hypothetical protein